MKILLGLISIIILIMMLGCSGGYITKVQVYPLVDFDDEDGNYYVLETGAEDTKDGVDGDKAWIIAGKGMFQDPQNGNMGTTLSPNDPEDRILLGTIGPSTPLSGMSTKVLIRPIPENDDLPGVRFALEKVNGDWEFLWNVPVIKKYNADGQIIGTHSCINMLYGSSPTGSFPVNRPKTYIPYFTFGFNYEGNFFTRGIPVSQFVQKTAYFSGVSGYTANGTSLIQLTPGQIADFTEPCTADMDLKIKWSGSQWEQQDTNWNATMNRWEVTLLLHPDQVFNFIMYALADPGTPKVFGVNVGEVECMNLYSYYGEFLTTAKTVNGVVSNIDPIDLRGEWGGIGPQ